MKRAIFLITLFAFIARLGLGVTAAVLLPQVGYESKTQQAGYLFFDAYRRDSQAWDLAQSGKPLTRAFDEKYSSDQYGGLLWMSAFVYRYLAGGVHQPLLIVVLAALAGSLGVLFVYGSVIRLADEKTAIVSALIFAFFPEAILQGAAQMREPFLMTFVAMAFYGLVEWQARQIPSAAVGLTSSESVPAPVERAFTGWMPWVWMGLALAGMLFISPAFVLVSLIAAAGWFYFDDSHASVGSSTTTTTATAAGNKFKIPWLVMAAAVGVFVIALLVLAASWNTLVTTSGGGVLGIIGSWARGTAKWNAYLLGRSSGIVQVLFQVLPPALAMPFVTIYGVLQPVLPAALFEPGILFWQVLGVIRALGWYLLLPLLAFAPFSAWGLPSRSRSRRRQWLWLNLVVWGWILIAAVRGGGDQWDNPRYRVILMAWMAMLAAQALDTLKVFYRAKASDVEARGTTGTNEKGSSIVSVLARPQPRPDVKRWFWRIIAVETIILLVFGHWYSWRYLGLGFNIGIRASLIIAIGFSVLLVLGDWVWQRLKPSSRL